MPYLCLEKDCSTLFGEQSVRRGIKAQCPKCHSYNVLTPSRKTIRTIDKGLMPYRVYDKPLDPRLVPILYKLSTFTDEDTNTDWMVIHKPKDNGDGNELLFARPPFKSYFYIDEQGYKSNQTAMDTILQQFRANINWSFKGRQAGGDQRSVVKVEFRNDPDRKRASFQVEKFCRTYQSNSPLTTCILRDLDIQIKNFPTRLVWDSEVDPRNVPNLERNDGRILCICSVGYKPGSGQTKLPNTVKSSIYLLKEDTDTSLEHDVLRPFLKEAFNYSCLMGFYSAKFDVPYTQIWIARLKIGWDFDFVTVFDLHNIYTVLNTNNWDSRKFNLDSIATREFGEGEGKEEIKDYQVLWDYWVNKDDHLTSYCLQDADLCRRIDEKWTAIDSRLVATNLTNVRPDAYLAYLQGIEAITVKKLNHRNPPEVLYTPFRKRFEGSYEGAMVFEPVKGVHDNVVFLDAKAMYPHIIRTFNIGLDTLDPHGEIHTQKANFRSNPDSVSKEVLIELEKWRDFYKKERDKYEVDTERWSEFEKKQWVIKYYMVSVKSDEPVIVRHHGKIKSLRIDQLPRLTIFQNHDNDKTLYTPEDGLEILTLDNCNSPTFKKITQISSHTNVLPITSVRTNTGKKIDVTENHSLISYPDRKSLIVDGNIKGKKLSTLKDYSVFKSCGQSYINLLDVLWNSQLYQDYILEMSPMFRKRQAVKNEMSTVEYLLSHDITTVSDILPAVQVNHKTGQRVLRKLFSDGYLSRTMQSRRGRHYIYKVSNRLELQRYHKKLHNAVGYWEFYRSQASKSGNWEVRISELRYPDAYTFEELSQMKIHAYMSPNKIACAFPITEKFCEYLGFWAAEGAGGFVTNYDKELRIKYSKILNDLGFETRLTWYGVDISKGGSMFSRIVRELCGKGSYYKKVPDFLLNGASEKNIKAFLRGWFEGDGYRLNPFFSGKSHSKLLLLGINVLLHILGSTDVFLSENAISAKDLTNKLEKRIHIEPERVSGKGWYKPNSTVNVYMLKYNKSRSPDFCETSGGVYGEEVKSATRLEPQDIVWDVAVEGTENFFAGSGLICTHNSYYGVLGSTWSFMYEPQVAEAITLLGQQVLVCARQILQHIGYQVLYGDTDSLSLNLKDSEIAAFVPTDAQVKPFRIRLCPKDSCRAELSWYWKGDLVTGGPEALCPVCKKVMFSAKLMKTLCLSRHLADIVAFGVNYYAETRFHVSNPQMEFEVDKVYDWCYFTSVKKRYAGSMLWKGVPLPEAKLKITGFEAKRTDWPELIQNIQKDTFMKLGTHAPLQDILKNVEVKLDEMYKGLHDREIIQKKVIRRKVTDYGKKTVDGHMVKTSGAIPPYVRAAKIMMEQRPKSEIRVAQQILYFMSKNKEVIPIYEGEPLPKIGNDFYDYVRDQVFAVLERLEIPVRMIGTNDLLSVFAS